MTFLKTLLGTLVLCTALLIWAGHTIGPQRSLSEPATGLTAAAVLASDGMAPDGSLDDGRFDRAAFGGLARTVSGGSQEAAGADKPAG